MTKSYKKKNIDNKVIGSTEKKVIVIDKLEIKFEIQQKLNGCLDIAQNLRLQEFTKNDAMQTNRFMAREYKYYSRLYYNNIQVGNFYYKKIDNELTNGTITICNSSFYTNLKFYFKDLLYNGKLNFTSLNIYKIDIAFDVNSNTHFKSLNKNYIKYSKGKVHLKHGTEFIERKPRGSYYIGSNKYIAIYDKCKELKKNVKTYILDYYKENKFDISKGVTRIELRLARNKGGFITRMQNDIKLEKILNQEYIANIVNEVFDKKLWIVYRDNDNRSRCTKKRLLNIDFKNYQKSIIYSKSTLESQPSIKVLKTTIKKMTYDWLNETDGDVYSDTYKIILKKVTKFKLQDWYENFITGTTFSNDFNIYIRLYN
jgi:hypothetical protein